MPNRALSKGSMRLANAPQPVSTGLTGWAPIPYWNSLPWEKHVAGRVVEQLKKESGAIEDIKGDRFREKFEGYLAAKGKDNIGQIRNTLRTVMTDKVSVFRTEDGIKEAIETLQELNARAEQTALSGHSLGHEPGTGANAGKSTTCWPFQWQSAKLLCCARNRGALISGMTFPDRKDEFNYHTLVTMRKFGEIEHGRREVDMSIFNARCEHYEHFGIIERKY